MSIERQNEIALFTFEGEQVSGPRFRKTTLAHPEALKPRQLAGAMHVHPTVSELIPTLLGDLKAI